MSATTKRTFANPEASFNKAVEEKMQLGLNRSEATRQVCKEQPDLHEAYLLAVNPHQQELVRSRFKMNAIA